MPMHLTFWAKCTGLRYGMNFSEQAPSKQWAALKYRGDKIAEVWFKPEGQPCVLTLRIPQESFQVPSLSQQLTLANLLKAVGIGPAEVEAHPDLEAVLAPPPPDVPHLELAVRLKPPPPLPAEGEQGADNNDELVLAVAQRQALEGLWKTILGLETAMDTVRMSLESVQKELESSLTRSLTLEEKTHALRADIAQWDRVKKRAHFAVPKVKEAIHRSIWALGAPERKRLGEVFKEPAPLHIPLAQVEDVRKQLEELQKDRQLLAALGKAVYQEAKGIAAEVQGALRILQQNAKTQRTKRK